LIHPSIYWADVIAIHPPTIQRGSFDMGFHFFFKFKVKKKTYRLFKRQLLTLIQSVGSLTFWFLSVSPDTTGTQVSILSFVPLTFIFFFKYEIHRFSMFQLGCHQLGHQLSENAKLIRLSAEWCTLYRRDTKSFFKGISVIQPTPRNEIKKRVAQHASIERGTRKKKRKKWQIWRENGGNTVYLT
jgi:hypothetical protein